MGLFNLFGGKKKVAASAVAAPVAAAPAPAKPVEAVKVAAPPMVAVAPAPAAAAAAGSEQVRLRLKLVAAMRAGKHAKAYEAAKGLADIQAKAGRRMAARMWREEAEAILASDDRRTA